MTERCKHPDGCNKWAMVLSGDGLCYDHSPTIADEERRAARRKGGRTSRKVQPLALADVGDIDTTADLKRFTVSVIKALVDGTITPNQARVCFTGSITLKSILELELYERLADRVKKLEKREGEMWQISEPSPGG